MSNEDQLTEIDALESIFGSSFTHLYNKHMVKSTLQPVHHEDAENINHIKADVYVIFGKTYPTTPLYSVFIDAVGMDEFKVVRFQDYIKQQLVQLSGDNNGTQCMVMSPNKGGQTEQEFKLDFFESIKSFGDQPLINTSGDHKSPGDIYLFELFESIREWLVSNNTREAKSLRDMVQNIDQIDEAERLRAANALEIQEEETKQYFDPYDEHDNVFVREYDSDIPIEPDQMCTTEVFEKWSVIFLEQQNIHRLKILAEQGKIDNSSQMTGKQLFLNNLVQELLDDDGQGAGAFTFVKPVQNDVNSDDDDDDGDNNNENNIGDENDGDDLGLDFDIDESLFDLSDDDDDDDDYGHNDDGHDDKDTTTTTTITPTSPVESVPKPTTTSSLLPTPIIEEKKSSSNKKDKKDDKKDKKSSSSNTSKKKDSKKSTTNSKFQDFGGGFSDFLGDF